MRTPWTRTSWLTASLGAVLALSVAPFGNAESQPPVQPNPFGVMLPPRIAASPRGMEVARELGAVLVRPLALFVGAWDGRCAACDAALQAGFKLVLTVRNGNDASPSPPVRDLAAYRKTLGEILDRYPPAVLVVENEENSRLFYTGTPEQYGAQLRAACEVAHAREIACANGGLVSSLVALLVYHHYLDTGRREAAEDFRRRAFPTAPPRQLESRKAREQVDIGRRLLQAYRAAGADYVNFHWYIADGRALQEAVEYLRDQTGLPAITNEVGQHTSDPADTVAIMTAVVKAGLPVAVWFALDGPKARGLVDPDGTLRPTGEAFRRFVEEHFGSAGS